MDGIYRESSGDAELLQTLSHHAAPGDKILNVACSRSRDMLNDSLSLSFGSSHPWESAG